jgi:transposase-like protein
MSVSGQIICRLAEQAADAPAPDVALRTLTELRRELDEFERQQVARALTGGESFGDVARALGISRQAVHRRFRDLDPRRGRSRARLAPTPEVRLVIDYARAEAAGLGADRLTAKLVLLGILRNGDRRAASALASAGVALDDARAHLRRAGSDAAPARTAPGGHPPGARRGGALRRESGCDAHRGRAPAPGVAER